MNYGRPIAGFVLVALVAIGARAAPQLVESHQELERELQGTRAQVRAIYDLAASGRMRELVDRIEAAEADVSLTPTAREYLIHETLIALSAVEPDPPTRALVERFRNRPVTSFIRLEHEHGNAIVPLYDLAAAAQLTRRNWDIRSAQLEVASVLRKAEWQPRQVLDPRPAMPVKAWRAGTISAIGNAESAVLLQYRAALLDAQQRDDAYADVVYAAARKLRDADMYRSLLASADDQIALQAVESAGQDLSAGVAIQYLADAASRESVASAAILQLGRLAADHDDATRRLFDLLGDRSHGASAALALARQSSPSILQALHDVIVEGGDELTSLRAALALRLSDSGLADDLRARLLQQDLPHARVVEALR